MTTPEEHDAEFLMRQAELRWYLRQAGLPLKTTAKEDLDVALARSGFEQQVDALLVVTRRRACLG